MASRVIAAFIVHFTTLHIKLLLLAFDDEDDTCIMKTFKQCSVLDASLVERSRWVRTHHVQTFFFDQILKLQVYFLYLIETITRGREDVRFEHDWVNGTGQYQLVS